MGALAAGAHGGQIRPGSSQGSSPVTAIVLWIAHVYAHSSRRRSPEGGGSDRGRGPERGEAGARDAARCCRTRWGALLLGAFGILQDSTAGQPRDGLGRDATLLASSM